MKIVATVLVVFSSYTYSLSQTIGTDWIFQYDESTKTSAVSNDEIFPRPEEGLDKVWDFSKAEMVGSIRNLVYADPELFEDIDSFPKANIGAESLGNSFYNDFYQKDGNDLLYLGFSMVTNNFSSFITIYSDPKTELVSPLTFGSSFQDDWRYDAYLEHVYSGDNYGTITTSFVGIGTIITPTDTYENCFMLKTEEQDAWNPPSLWYKFYKNNLSNLVASYSERGMSSTGEPIKTVRFRSGELNMTSTEDLTEFSVDLFIKNNEHLQLNSDNGFEGQLAIYSIDGKLLYFKRREFRRGENFIPINLSKSGMYIAMLTDMNSNNFKSFKLYW